jgi:hypothetical protein
VKNKNLASGESELRRMLNIKEGSGGCGRIPSARTPKSGFDCRQL